MRGLVRNIEKDSKYVYPLIFLVSGLNLLMLCAKSTPLSFISDGALRGILFALCALAAALSLGAMLYKLINEQGYKKSCFRGSAMVRASQYAFMLMLLCFALIAADRVILALVFTVREAVAADSKPQEFFPSMIYMFYKGKSMFAMGVWTTVRIALLGTAIAFALSVPMTFLRVQSPDRRDKDIVKLFKMIGCGFTKLYITVIRGTPMMVQALIFYYAGFSIFKSSGMTVTEINNVWSFFTSGLITVSLNSTAYLTEVLRGGIEAVDAGQTEAARSLGMTPWQSMMKVTFPQGVKNSIPAIGNEFIINIKDSSVLSVIGVFDLMYATTTVNGIYYGSLQIYCVAAVIYLMLTYCSSLIMKGIAGKMNTKHQGVPSSN